MILRRASFLKETLIKIWNKYMDYKILLDDKRLRKKQGVPRLMTIEETILYILNNNCSVSRYGDGELKLISGERIYFQEYDKSLSKRLACLLKSPKKGCLICIPDMFAETQKYLQPHKRYIDRVIALHRKEWYDAMDMQYLYGNAFISRGYQIWKDKSLSKRWFESLKKIWDGKAVVFVEGEKTRLGYGNDLFSNANSIERILCPQMNAFSKYDRILETVKKIEKEKLIILALGPTATILAYDLHKLGYQALDLGHIDIEYEWFLQRATEKIKIKGKFISEAPGGTDVEEVLDPVYQNQIIDRIG